MRVTTTALILAAAVSTALSSAAAQTPQAAPVDLIIQEGFSELIDVPGTFQDVAIGNPAILDIQPITANTLLLNGLERGTTNILIIDDDGRAIYRARVHVRPVRIWPGYRINVVHGTSLRAGYSCDRETGCQAQEQQPTGQQPANIFLGDTVANTNATAAGPGAAPAPAAE